YAGAWHRDSRPRVGERGSVRGGGRATDGESPPAAAGPAGSTLPAARAAGMWSMRLRVLWEAGKQAIRQGGDAPVRLLPLYRDGRLPFRRPACLPEPAGADGPA